MKVCERAVNLLQIMNADGEVRGCGWANNAQFGSLFDNSLEEIWNGKKARDFRESKIRGDYSDCPVDNCPYLSNGTLEENSIDIDDIPEFPQQLYLAYEGVCNYKCTCCTSYCNMQKSPEVDYQKRYDIIEEKLKNYLPYVKCISAHGRGELFASKRILKILSEWKPVAPKDEVEVVLETNGSLFDKEHWKMIENLGQYNLYVAITVMSFNESVYKYLSGVSYPIQKIENNLLFVKSLKERGIINMLELATVLQEQNFREMPEMTKRFIEEFGADIVRIRPIMPGGRLDESSSWFMDVRNPYHPYYNEYKKVMENEIFNHPRVLLWSNDLDAQRGEHPLYQTRKLFDKEVQVTNILMTLLLLDDISGSFTNYCEKLKVTSVAIYGLGKLGKVIVNQLSKYKNERINFIIDNTYNQEEYKGYKVIKFREGLLDDIDMVLITPIDSESIRNTLESYSGLIIELKDIIKEL